MKEGIDAVIVDSVLAIRKGLTSTESGGELGNSSPKIEELEGLNGVVDIPQNMLLSSTPP